MKTLRNVWLYLSFLLLVTGMAGCSTEEDPQGIEVAREDLIGSWRVTANDWKDSEGDSGTNDQIGLTVVLKNDGTASFQNFQYRWTLDGKNGVLTLSGSGEQTVKVTILSFVNDEIKVTYFNGSSSEMYEVEGNYTFKRSVAQQVEEM